jgi:hypothetical protein
MGSAPLEIPENSTVYPAELSYAGATIGSNPWRRDYHQRWYFYRDPTSGRWAGQLVQDPGTSDAY